ncbi:MAG: hypothetical protein H0U76_03890 [Ktedonobacteraceae bacterium]|nr:hypothetical protein [Ktedonobacteraceae bacterium]
MLISQLALPLIILGIVLFLIGLVVYQVKYRGSYSWIILQQWYRESCAKDREALHREVLRERSQQIARRHIEALKRDHRNE